ncbi:MAG: phenylacetate--CoA ligase family protein [Gammaproteobacteria bacterium]|nr:phenylacetate--CoA ligase family protein [Gammaproteobacteria bacterium]
MDKAKSGRALHVIKEYIDTPLDDVLSRHHQQSPADNAVSLFHDVAQTVPAYQQFLDHHRIRPEDIHTIDAFRRLPFTNKPDYLNHYPLASLCREGRIDNCDMFAVSSGSTGAPGFWPRFVTDEIAITRRFEQVFCDSFKVEQRSTLAVICFALGTWVGGLYSTACCRHLATKGYPVNVIAPGNNKQEIIRVVTALGSEFEQVVLLGYPPFIKDVIDTGLAQGLEWSKLSIKMVYAGEVFSEEWRTLVCQRAGVDNPCYDTASLYGTADAGVLGNETPLSICIRRFLADKPDVARQLFGESRLPTLVQYDPLSRYFEENNGTLLFSGDNGIPLIRYHISDEGGLISYREMLKFLDQHGFDPIEALGGESAAGIRTLPFVFIFGRSHFVLSYFGANIYPENVTVGLEQPGISQWVTGKFVMQIIEDDDCNRRLSIIVELAPSETASEKRRNQLTQSILKELRRLNSEFANYVPDEYQRPQIQLKSTGDPKWFPTGVKHRYTRE